MKMKQIIPIYMVLNGLGSIVPTILGTSFAITLFEIDTTGISAAYLEPASLLGIGSAGLIGGFFLKRFSAYTIGIGALLSATLTLLALSVYGSVHLRGWILTLWALACIMSIEHSNGLAFMSKQIGSDDRPFFFSNFQIFLQCFNVLAPILAKNLLAMIGLKAVLLLCSFVYILRIIPWQLCRVADIGAETIVPQPFGVLTGFKEIVQNSGLLRITSFRLVNYIATIAYTVGLPILVARIAKGDSQVNATLHSYSISMIHLGFIVSGICGSWILRKKPKWIIGFFNISPVFIVLASTIAFYVTEPYYLQATALLYGMGLYLFRTAIAIIGQALTKKEKLAHVILVGDAVVKSFAYGVGSLIPFWIVLPPLWGIAPPFVGFVLCSLLSLGMIKPITKIYLASLCKKNNTK
ncbi:Major Facilitator Superfamily transporter [Cardinium endosymbiont cBtQ1 of Bemisia tabaci]|uniref:MFS transporter n=2 Tax=Cardinium endosymbiont of Bemisia tabaci TaxID=672794 RepID=UPI000442D34A|nr:MFS transporter [Cardinium endosymbiont of Bemisia tabaci]CDG49982.1 Major Facilitator Superfamily transporter [Cardinium endosymbiont cBtQ1 of Bemisia tabaci]